MKLLTTAETAAILRVSKSKVSRLAKSGELEPVVRAPGLRGACMFDPDDVESLLVKLADCPTCGSKANPS